MKNEKGITLISLVITIIVLIILASVTTYAGLNSIRTSKLTRFRQELELMQSQVNLLYEKYKDEETITIGKDISEADSTKVENAFNSIGSQVTQADYRYFDVDTLKDLGIEGIDEEYLVNIKTRDVISLDGFKYEGAMYYTLEQITGQNNDYGTLNRGEITFYTSYYNICEDSNCDKLHIIIGDIQLSKYVGKCKIQYYNQSSDKWITLVKEYTGKDYEFAIDSNDGVFVRITDASGNYTEKFAGPPPI